MRASRLRLAAVLTVATVAVCVLSAPASQAVTADSSRLVIRMVNAIKYGAGTTVHARLVDTATGAGIGGARLWLQAQPAGNDIVVGLGPVVTGPYGRASITVSPQVNTRYDWVYDGDAAHLATQSRQRTLLVRQRLTIRSPQVRNGIERGTALTVWGRVAPDEAGRVVGLQKPRPGGGWVTFATTRVKRQRMPDGTVTIGYKFRIGAVASDLRTRRRPTPVNAAGVSPVLRIVAGIG